MIEAISIHLGMPRHGVVALLLLVAVQLVMQVLALIDLARRDSVVGGKKRVWLIAILFGNLLGALIYLGLGRRLDAADPDSDSREESAGAAGKDVLDRLYGPKSATAL